MVTQQQLVKTRPIILRPHEVRGILDGTVTQLWRAMGAGQYARSYHPYDGDLDDDGWPLACYVGTGCLIRVECPYGGPGSRLWGRERWRIDWTPACGHGVRYAVDEQFICRNNPDQAGYQWLVAHYGGNNHTEPQRSSATMPRWASRTTLEIESVSALPVQGMTEADAKAAGMAGWAKMYCSQRPEDELYARAYFELAWDRDNPRHPYASNPMAWRLVVRRVEA